MSWLTDASLKMLKFEVKHNWERKDSYNDGGYRIRVYECSCCKIRMEIWGANDKVMCAIIKQNLSYNVSRSILVTGYFNSRTKYHDFVAREVKLSLIKNCETYLMNAAMK